ncbi:hypothetical protein HMPREF2953_07655 [Staphylococcus sp. HMSC072E01]|uniref:hypothetical protein n=1 Tax=Staphylococcus sp. HMSC072E01 TaxID=1739457 RepID=UPI0008A605E0|nr:hypothetical protein [Staphylococcus sp. HMSC072E01]OFQ08476.1 hypothetical protein HMPREF2953_07655 [Staphylococcus sp. HMSC072E01]
MTGKKPKALFWAIAILISLGVIALLIIGFICNFDNEHNDKFVGLCTLFTGILAITGVCFTIFNSQRLKNKELLNDLDQKSEWRKELMNIAAKPVIRLEDVYRILASLRFLPKRKDEIEGNEKKNIKESEQKDFDKISNYIYKELHEILDKHYGGLYTDIVYSKKFLNRVLNIKDADIVRLYTKFLLKHHWEYNQSEKDKKKFKKKELKEFKNVMEEIYRLNQEDNIKNDYYKIDDIYIGVLNDYTKEIEKKIQR